MYAVDKVGNVSDPVIVSVDNDSSAPDISSAQIGINATGVLSEKVGNNNH